MKLLDRFNRCNTGPWTSAGLNVQYRIENTEDEISIYFQPTSDTVDWMFDFFFATAPFAGYRVHAGFLEQWLSIAFLPDIMNALNSSKPITIVGYSLGAALAVLATTVAERIDPKRKVTGIGFGTPRVFWLNHPSINFTRYNVPLDLVTHLPFVLFGYFPLGRSVKLKNTGGYRGKFWMSHHTPEQYRRGLTWQDNVSTS